MLRHSTARLLARTSAPAACAARLCPPSAAVPILAAAGRSHLFHNNYNNTGSGSSSHASQRRHNSDNVGPGRAFVQAFASSLKRQVEDNKQLTQNVKLLAAEANKLSESDSIKKARELAEGGTSATSEAIKKTGQVVGKVAETVSETVSKVAETPVGKAAVSTVKGTAKVVGDAAEAAVRPITESERYKQLSEELNTAIQAASIRYGGVTSKHYRDLIKRKRLLDHEMRSKITENTEALGMVLREDTKWKRSWDHFKETSPLAQTMFALQSRVAESDNLVVSWGRWLAESVQDKMGGLFEETETAKTMTLLKQLDPSFNLEEFMREAREFILPEVLEAWLHGDKQELARWCSEASMRVLTAQHDELVKQGLVSDSRLVELKQVDVAAAKVLENNIPVLMLSFTTQEVILYRDRITKEVKIGKEDVIMRCTYVVVLTIEEGNDDPITRGWKVVDQAKHATGSMV